MINRSLLISWIVALPLLSFAELTRIDSCEQDPARLQLRSAELASIVQADQDERANWRDWPKLSPSEIDAIALRDLQRRQRVAEIFAEGCFSKSQDYAAAALVFQHGNTPDHFFQVFFWSKRGVDLGDESQKSMMAKGIDRYLVRTGHKQLFAS